MEEDILNYLYQLSCFVGHPVIFSQIQKLFWKIQYFIFGFTSPYFKKYFICKSWTLKKNNIGRTRISRWLGREIVVVGLPSL